MMINISDVECAISTGVKGGGDGSVGRARDSWSGGRGSDPRARSHTGWIGVSIM